MVSPFWVPAAARDLIRQVCWFVSFCWQLKCPENGSEMKCDDVGGKTEMLRGLAFWVSSLYWSLMAVVIFQK